MRARETDGRSRALRRTKHRAPDPPAQRAMLDLQRAAGNDAVRRLVTRHGSTERTIRRALALHPEWDTGYGWKDMLKGLSSWPAEIASLRQRFHALELILAGVADVALTDQNSAAFRARAGLESFISDHSNSERPIRFSQEQFDGLDYIIGLYEDHSGRLPGEVRAQAALEATEREKAAALAAQQANAQPEPAAAEPEPIIEPQPTATDPLTKAPSANNDEYEPPPMLEPEPQPEPLPPTPLEKAQRDIDDWLVEEGVAAAVLPGERNSLVAMEMQVIAVEVELESLKGKKNRKKRQAKEKTQDGLIDQQNAIVAAVKQRITDAKNAAERPALDPAINVSRWDSVAATATRPAYQKPGVFQVQVGDTWVQMGLNLSPITKHLAEFLLRRIAENSLNPRVDVADYVNSLAGAVVSLGEKQVKSLAKKDGEVMVGNWELMFQDQGYGPVCYHAVPKGGGANPYWTPKGYKGGPV